MLKIKLLFLLQLDLNKKRYKPYLVKVRVLRVLPNLACKVKKSITIFTEKNNLKNEELDFAKNLFKC